MVDTIPVIEQFDPADGNYGRAMAKFLGANSKLRLVTWGAVSKTAIMAYFLNIDDPALDKAQQIFVPPAPLAEAFAGGGSGVVAHKGTHVEGGTDAFKIADVDILDAFVKGLRDPVSGTNMEMREVLDGRVLQRFGATIIGVLSNFSAIYAQLSSSVDQIPSVTTPVPIEFNTQDAIVGLTHSTSTDPSEITIDTSGVYLMNPQSQVGKSSGSSKATFDKFVQKNTGSGFVDIANSNVKIVIKDFDVTDVIIINEVARLSAGDKIRFMQRVSNSTVGLGLQATAAEVGPPTVPATPSIIYSMFRIGS